MCDNPVGSSLRSYSLHRQMFWFWLAVGVLACVATASLAFPLLFGARRDPSAAAPSDEARRVAVYRDRRAEIEAERAAGRLTEDEAKRALDELIEDAARQLSGPDTDAAPQASQPRPAAGLQNTVLVVLAALIVPATALAVYAMLGTPQVVGLDRAALRGEMSPASLSQSLTMLRERVRRSPDDVEGWVLLGQATRMSGNHAESAAAYERASALAPNEAWLIAEQAESVMLAQGGNFAGRPVQLLERALAIDPNDSKSVALMGAAQFRLGNREQALVYMRKLQTSMPPGSPEAQHIGELIARIESGLGGAGGGSARGGAPADGAGAAGARASASAPAPGSAVAPGATAATAISGTVTIDPALQAQVPPGATMFVLARGTDGSRVPIAAQRVRVDRWPIAFTLSDAQAMNPGRLLSEADSVILEARVSRGGTAARQSGDPFGVSAAVKLGAQGIVLHIDQKVP
ncbi:MAG: c-type cytochrome biogenesis protein CcmI [Burkholderiales bacterium]|nr:MAG: c-type cytochrome biogenesis protein CcmI [Burkholderiales bacterium]